METIKAYTTIEQSKKLAKVLPLESADMVLPFRHPKNDEYIPGYVVSRNYVEVYNEMIKLPAMEKEDVCKLIHPCWSLSALFGALPKNLNIGRPSLNSNYKGYYWIQYYDEFMKPNNYKTECFNNPVDACVNMIIKLNELNLL